MPNIDRQAGSKFDAMPNYSSGVWRGRTETDLKSKETLIALVSGPNRSKYFKQPLKHKRKLDDEPKVHIPSWLKTCLVPDPPLFVSTATQTDYRESDTQTDPWDVPYKAIGDPEILTLKPLIYGNGLPVLKNRVIEDIERARERRTVEKQIQVCENENRRTEQFRLTVQQRLKDMAVNISDLRSNQIEKLAEMKTSLENEVRHRENRRMEILECMWEARKEELANKSERLHDQFARSVHILTKKRSALTKDEPSTVDSLLNITNPSVEAGLHMNHSLMKMKDSGDNYYLSDPKGLVELERWMWEEQKMLMEPEIYLPHIERSSASFPRDFADTKRRSLADIKEDFKPKPPKGHQKMQHSSVTLSVPVISETVLSQEYSTLILQKTMRGRAVQKEVRAIEAKYASLIAEQRMAEPWAKEEQLEIEKEKGQKHLEYMEEWNNESKAKDLDEVISRFEGSMIASELLFLGRAPERFWVLKDIRQFISAAYDLRRRREAEEAGRRQQELIFREVLSHICNEVAETQETFMDLLNDVMPHEQ